MRCKFGLFISIILILLSGCYQDANVRRERFIRTHPDMSKEKIKAIREGRVILGMSPKEVEASWGKPDRIETKVTKYGGYRCWIYEKIENKGKKRIYFIYFQDNKVSGLDQRVEILKIKEKENTNSRFSR